ncbi:hypothetical protein [Clostridium brassicae]|uniref:Transporter n=1 Tax=Clostridium brassicae TaxID=2999072 RepID=A0ABT4D7T1_9CLOT|nr:hypothetical protein [Clostridium brassicae]MCY6957094.1 hypothetical protein [Clostridium brassicae]
MIMLQMVHYVYIILISVILLIIFLKKDAVLPCLIAILITAYVFTHSFLKSIQVLFNSIVISGREFIEIIVIIALLNSMSKVLKDMGADELIIKPLKKFMTNSSTSFFVLGITMLLVSWIIWPTPAVAFIGAIMVPAAVESGLPAVWAAVCLSLFGNGAALSSDYFIQAAPAITARTAGADNPFDIIKATVPFWIIMSVSTIAVAYYIMKKELKITNYYASNSNKKKDEVIKAGLGTKFIAFLTPVSFLIDMFFIYKYKLKGGNATALIGGTSIIIMVCASIIKYNLKNSLNHVRKYIVEGFIFGIKVFAPIIIISAFFFLGSKETASVIFQAEVNGFLTDIGIYISNKIPLNKISAVIMQTGISALLGVGGSGFAGLPLVGTLAQVFNKAIGINKYKIASLGQIITIWIGGGTIIPWSVVPIAAVCDVEPFELARRNIIPILIGIIITVIFSIVLV